MMSALTTACLRVLHTRLRILSLKNANVFLRFSSGAETNSTDEIQPQKEPTEAETPSQEEDFFGIEADDGDYINERFQGSEALFAKYEAKKRNPLREKVYITNFGKISLDSENLPSSHPGSTKWNGPPSKTLLSEEETPRQRRTRRHKIKTENDVSSVEQPLDCNVVSEEPKKVNISEVTKSKLKINKHKDEVPIANMDSMKKIKDSYIDKEYFPDLIMSESPQPKASRDRLATNNSTIHEPLNRDPLKAGKYTTQSPQSSYIDEVYFTNYVEDESTNVEVSENKDPVAVPTNYIDEQYFPREAEPSSENVVRPLKSADFMQLTELKGDLEDSHEKVKKSVRAAKKKTKQNRKKMSTQESSSRVAEDDDTKMEVESRSNESEETSSFLDRSKKPVLKTASDYVKMQRERKKDATETDRQQTKPDTTDSETLVYSGQPKSHTIDFHNQTEDEVLQILKDSIIYNDHGIVALNKPHGIACQHGSKHFHHILKFIPRLAEFIAREAAEPELYTVHRVDVGTTGVLLLAKNQKTAHILHQFFKQRKIQKKYWAITKGVPSPPEGIINIPIAEGTIDNRARMVLKAVIEDDVKPLLKKSSVQTHDAITQYRVLSSQGHAALVELIPFTGVKHQLRVHFGFGLNCPVLGDHKYSHLTKLAPQRLPQDMLDKLQVRQTKVRDLPIHLHARSVVIPELADGRNIFIQAALPKHFKWALQKLKLSK